MLLQGTKLSLQAIGTALAAGDGRAALVAVGLWCELVQLHACMLVRESRARCRAQAIFQGDTGRMLRTVGLALRQRDCRGAARAAWTWLRIGWARVQLVRALGRRRDGGGSFPGV